jgi:8-oxo-dGTP diphosphatase
MPPAPPLIVVAAALIDLDQNVLVQQRPSLKSMAGLWEFPGGKVEHGETPEQALVRELNEELGISINPASLSPVGFASEQLGHRHLILLLFSCHLWEGVPKPLDADALLWISPSELSTLAMPPPDVQLIDLLKTQLAAKVPTP